MFWLKHKIEGEIKSARGKEGGQNHNDKRWTLECWSLKCIRILYFWLSLFCKPVDLVDTFQLRSFFIVFIPFGCSTLAIFISVFVCFYLVHFCFERFLHKYIFFRHLFACLLFLHAHTYTFTHYINEHKKRSHTFVWLKLILLIWKNQMKLELNEIKSRKINNFIWNKKCKKNKLRFHSCSRRS